MWSDLSMAERAKYIRLGVSTGITDLNVIRDTYNSYAGGGLLSSEQLLEKVKNLGHKAYINKDNQLVTMAGTPLIYNYKEDRFEFKPSNGVPMWMDKNGTFKRYNLKNRNTHQKSKTMKRMLDYPALYQSILEDEAFTINRNKLNKQRAVPFLEDQKHTIERGISKGVPISTNLVDSVKSNLSNTQDRLDALGITSRETNVGNYPSYFAKKPEENQNFSVFERSKSATPSDLLNNHNYYISPVRGALNAAFPSMVEAFPALVYGSPDYYYRPEDIDTSDIERLSEIEKNLRYQRSKGKFDPFKKIVKKDKRGKVVDYYNPEDNPWIHAVQGLQDRDYGMGSLYRDKVKKDSKDIEYLLSL